MSTILKALRRLEQDKAAEADQPLQIAVAQPATPVAPAPRRGRWILGALAAASLGAAVVLLLQPRGEISPSAVSAAPPASRAASPIAAQAPIAAPAPTPPRSPVAAAPASPPVAAAVSPPAQAASGIDAAGVPDAASGDEPLDLASEPAAEAVPAPVPVSPPPAVPSAAPARAIAQESAPPAPLPSPVAVAPMPASPPLPEVSRAVETPVRVARLEPRATAPKPALPGRATASAEAGAVVAQPVTRATEDPSDGDEVRTAPPVHKRTARAAPMTSGVTVLHTVWHPRAERRTALVAMPGDALPKEYREGDRVGSMTLLRIEPSGVVFDREGVEIREKIGERP